MICIYECMDCANCGGFCDGLRITCLHPDLPPYEIYKYYPSEGETDAILCDGFEEGTSPEFPMKDLGAAEEWLLQQPEIPGHPDGGYCARLREWIEERKAGQK